MISRVMFRLLPVFFLLLLHSCATNSQRVKERPNFSLTGAAAAEEIKKFEIDKMSYRFAHFKREKWSQMAKREEMNEMLKDVSPKTYEILQQTKTKENLSWIFLAAFLATGFTQRGGDNFIFPPMQWAALGLWIGYDMYLSIDRNRALDQYDQDLKSKFSPSVGYSFSFD